MRTKKQNSSRGQTRLRPEARIRLTTRRNPRREGTVKFRDFEAIRRNSGKTVESFLTPRERAAPRLRGALRSAIRHGWVRQVG